VGGSLGLELTRRDFLKLSAVAGAGVLLSSHGLRFLKPVRAQGIVGEEKERYVPGICAMCPADCNILVRVRNGRAERIMGPEWFPSPKNKNKICARGNSGIFRLYNPDRLKQPLIRDDKSLRGTWKGFRAASWNEAYRRIADHLKKLVAEGRSREIAILGGWLSCEVYSTYLFPFLRAVGSPNGLGTPTSQCFFPKAFGWTSVIGLGMHSQILTDYDNVNYLIVMRRNIAGSIPVVHGVRFGQNLGRYKKVVVVDPRFSETAAKADEWIPIKPGTDLALLLAMMNVIIEEKLYDEDYLKKYTNAPMLLTEELKPYKTIKGKNGKIKYYVWDKAGNRAVLHEEAAEPALEGTYTTEDEVKVKPVFEFLKEKVKDYTPEWAENITDVPAAKIRNLAREFATTKPAAIDTGWHGARHANEMMTWRAAGIVNALVGSLLKTGGIIFTGEGLELPKASTPSPEYVSVVWGEKHHIPLAAAGMSAQALYDAMAKGDPYPIKTLFVIATNPVLNICGRVECGEALKKLDMLVVIDILPIDTAAYADIILPEHTYLERDDPLFNMPYAPAVAVETRFKAVDPLYNTRHVIDMMVGILKAMGEEYYEKYWEYLGGEINVDASKLREYYERYGVRGIMLAQAETRKIPLDELMKKGFVVIEGEDEVRRKDLELLEKGELPTPTGKVELFSLKLFELLEGCPKEKILYCLPLVEWAPPEILNKRRSDDEFYVAYGKVPTMTHTSAADNPMLQRLTPTQDYRVWINRESAEKLGIRNGDKIIVKSLKSGREVEAIAFVTEHVRPDTIWLSWDFGQHSEKLRFKQDFPTVTYSDLLIPDYEPLAGAAKKAEIIVKIRKA